MMSGFESGDMSIKDNGSPMMHVLDKLPIGVALMNDTGELLYLNPAFKDISDDPRFSAAFQKLNNGEQVNDLLSLTRADENNREVEHTYRGFHLDGSSDKNNGHSKSMMLVEDITESYRLKKNLSRAQRMESVGSMASAVAHDFNNILTVILQSVHLLKQNLPQDQDYLDPLDVIEGTTLSAGELAQQLLTLSKPRTTEGRDLDLNAVINDALPILERVLHEGINLEFEFEEN
ncbi:histidine kinase dimerization/phospho-acceptor domain-containing protein, partial [Gemmatimonadota bacterium]